SFIRARSQSSNSGSKRDSAACLPPKTNKVSALPRHSLHARPPVTPNPEGVINDWPSVVKQHNLVGGRRSLPGAQ
ncbi:MAG TPA: hypothetical protein VF783_08145, partial [Terriglobales bacterium]